MFKETAEDNELGPTYNVDHRENIRYTVLFH